MVCFGEMCLAKLNKDALSKEEVPKLAARWCRAIFLGYDRESNEYVMHTQGRLLKTRAVQRITKASRWNPEAVQEVTVSPYSSYKKPEVEKVFMKDPSIEREHRHIDRYRVVRDIRLYQRDFEAHGYTNHGCERCSGATRYGWAQPTTASHSKECRDRM